MTVLAFLLTLGVLITVHEWGHYRVAIAFGVKVETFSIGFGKPLWRWRSTKANSTTGTEFQICLIPLGGYVKMVDESQGDVSPQDLPRAFNRQAVWARAAIVAAGPVANLLLAVCLYAATFWIGQYEVQATLAAPTAGSVAEAAGLRSGDTVLRAGSSADAMQEITSLDDLRWWVLQHEGAPIYLEVQAQGKQASRLLSLAELPEPMLANDVNAWQALGLTRAWSRPVVGTVQNGLPAQLAGLQRGDEVLRIDGQAINDAHALREMIRASGQHLVPAPQNWEISRQGQLLRLQVQPVQMVENGLHVGRIGAQVGESPIKVWTQSGAFEGLSKAITKTWNVIVLTLDMLMRLVTGNASLNNLSGPLTLADAAGQSASIGLGAYLSYLALVSVSLGVFNLLPLPMLDGGHLLYYLYEVCTGHPPTPQWIAVMQRGGFAVLVALMALSFFNDMVRLGWLN